MLSNDDYRIHQLNAVNKKQIRKDLGIYFGVRRNSFIARTGKMKTFPV